MIRHKTSLVMICLAVGTQVAALPGGAQTQSAPVQVPIREVDLSDGTRRYAITIKVDGHPIDAGLDTGSVGLRVLLGVIDSATTQEVGPVRRYGYSVGTTLEGPVVRTEVSVGDLHESARWQDIHAIGCCCPLKA